MTTSFEARPDADRKWVGLVTGATSGIGRAVAMALPRLCSLLVVVGRDQKRLTSVCEAGNDSGGTVVGMRAELSDPVQVLSLADAVRARCDRLDVLVHAAASIIRGFVAESRIEDFREQFAVNVLAPFALTKALLPLLESARGQVVFVNSSIVFHASAGTAQYAATKHALKGFADHLRQETNPLGIRVLSVFPGRTATPLQEKLYGEEGKEYIPDKLLQPEEVASVICHSLTMPPTAEITDILIRPAQRT